jgi:arginine/lysine/ornithine decarboxylase
VFEAMRQIPPKSAIDVAGDDVPVVPGETVMSPRQAYFSEKRRVAVGEAVGEICAGVHVPIPPCAPIVIPGEKISQDVTRLLEQAGIREIDVIFRFRSR